MTGTNPKLNLFVKRVNKQNSIKWPKTQTDNAIVKESNQAIELKWLMSSTKPQKARLGSYKDYLTIYIFSWC